MDYCDTDDIKNRLSAVGVTLRTDDSPPDDLGDVIDEASAMIEEHCLLGYTETNLAASRWANHVCADLATALLCERRGNPMPAGIARRHERAMERLEKVRLGSMLIPDIAARKEAVPVMSNVRIVQRPFNRTVVERNRSTGKPADYKQERDPLDWTNLYLDYVI